MSKLFFVYGTLQQGHGNNSFLENARFVGPAKTLSKFILVNCGFPYMVPADEVDTDIEPLPVQGEVWEVTDDETERGMDYLEGVSYGHYRRATVDVEGIEGEVHTYVPCDPQEKLTLPLCGVVDGAYKW